MANDLSSVRIMRLNLLMRQLITFPGLPRQELMVRAGINTQRMLQRDIQYLREFYDADIEYDFRRQAYICKNPGSFFIQLKLNQEEIVALVAGLDMAKHFLPHLAPSCDSVWAKLEEILPAETVAEGKSLGHSARVALPIAKMDPEIFRKLLCAAHKCQSVSILYKSPYSNTGLKLHKLSPWKFFFQEHAWYMLAWNHRFQKEGVWRLSRIQDAHITDEPYTPCPCEEEFENIISSAWFGWSKELKYSIEMNIKPPLASLVQEIVWHPTQTIEEQPDGSVILKAKVSELEPVKEWAEGHKAELSVSLLK